MHEIGSEGDISHSSGFSKMLHKLKMYKLQISKNVHITEHNAFIYKFYYLNIIYSQLLCPI